MIPKKDINPLQGILAIAVFIFFVNIARADDDPQLKKIEVGAGERGIEATVVEGPPIKPDQLLTKDHPQYAKGMTCAECHQVSFDSVTSATRQYILNFPQLPKDKIWEKIVAFLPGRERFVLTTVYKNEPTATTVDMVLDPQEKALYLVAEKGTEKLLHIKENPVISAVHFAGWTLAEGGKKEWKSVQIKGKAEIITTEEPRFATALDKYAPARVTRERARRRFNVVKITPLQIFYFDTNLSQEGASIYQLWKE